MNKIFKFIIIYIIIFMVIMFFYKEFYNYISDVDSKMRDFMFKIRGEQSDSKIVTIIDIDDKSINRLGQWPWSRDKMAKLVTNLNKAGAIVIGFDIVFSEEDRTSPAKIFKKFNISKKNLPDYDADFAKSILSSTVVLGYKFLKNKNINSSNDQPLVPVLIRESGLLQNNDTALKAKGLLNNIPILQNNSYSNGFFNIDFTNTDSTIRKAPLVMKYDNKLYPSFALELYRIATASTNVKVHYNQNGIDSIELDDITIPTDLNGRIIINYRGAHIFKYISAIDIINNTFDKSDIKNKIILVGTSATGIYDMRSTPFSSNQPGIEVHANIIDNILIGDFISKPEYVILIDILRVAIIIFLLMLSNVVFKMYGFVIFFISLMGLDYFIAYYFLFTKTIIIDIFITSITSILLFISLLLKSYYTEVRKIKNIKKKFANKVSKGVMEDILKNQDISTFTVKEKEVTMFFSDIREFTSISESLNNSMQLVKMLNSYIEPMTNIIMNEDGTIDKYIGDAIMAYWNAPLDVNNHADKAVISAINQIKKLQTLNIEFKKNGFLQIDIGIGINTAKVVVGEIGSKNRSDYTIIGDPVNLTSRLESLTKFYGCQIIISEFTYNQLTKQYSCIYLDKVAVKGKTSALKIYSIFGTGKLSKKEQEELDIYNKAIKLYEKQKFKNAHEIFKILMTIKNSRHLILYEIYRSRCLQYIKNPPMDFDGVFIHNTK